MIGYNSITEFDNYIRDNRVRQLTVITYRPDGEVWSERTGEILRHPKFGGSGIGTSISFRLHMDPEHFHGYFSDLWFIGEHDERISFEVSEEDATGTLHGFVRLASDEHDEPHGVDIVVHARAR